MKTVVKFNLIMLITAFFISSTAIAQHVNFGVKGGVNLYNVINENSSNYNSKVGIHLGLLAHIHLDKSIALQPELVYSTQGGKFVSNGIDYNLKLNYINVPVLLQYMFDNGFRLEAGPQLGFLINAKSDSKNSSTDVKANFKAIDFAVAIGVGYIKPSTRFGVDFRYNVGLNDINKSDLVNSSNRGFQLGVFYQFKHK